MQGGGPVDCGELSSLPGLHSLAARVLLLVGVSRVGEKAPPRSSHRGVGDDEASCSVL